MDRTKIFLNYRAKAMHLLLQKGFCVCVWGGGGLVSFLKGYQVGN